MQVDEGFICPIVLDLDGNGIQTVTLAAGVHFDHDGNLRAELSGWTGAGDGLLVWDRNNDGLITSGAELLGNQTLLPDGTLAANGFAALAAYDNGDGQITAADQIYVNLGVWRDENGNGEVESGELTSLADWGVTAISTAWVDSTFVDPAGNAHRQIGTFVMNGTSRGAADVWFSVDLARTTELVRAPLPEDVEALPQAKGFGEVHDLRQAMASDSTLKTLVQQFVSAGDAATREALLDQILFQWTGSASIDANNGGPTNAPGALRTHSPHVTWVGYATRNAFAASRRTTARHPAGDNRQASGFARLDCAPVPATLGYALARKNEQGARL